MKLSGKGISKFWSSVAVIILIGYSAFYVITKGAMLTTDEAKALLIICSGIIIFNSPFYISIWLDKFLKKGDQEEEK